MNRALVVLVITTILTACADTRRLVRDGEVDAKLWEEISQSVAKQRGDALKAPVPVATIDPAGAREKLVRALDVERSAEEWREAARGWAALGLVEKGADPRALVVSELGTQRAFYATDEKKVYLVVDPEAPEVEATFEEASAASQIAHALQDRTLGLRAFLTAGGDDDGRLARRALIAGEAAELATRHLESQDDVEARRCALVIRRAVTDPSRLAAHDERWRPRPLAEWVSFPRRAGHFYFAEKRRRKDAADILALPPRSTCEVLNVERGEPFVAKTKSVALAGAVPPPGWSLVREDVLGSAGVRALVSEASPALVGFEKGLLGDRYRVLANEKGETALVWVLSFEARDQARNFLLAYEPIAKRKSPGAAVIETSEDGLTARIIEAPDRATVEAIAPAARKATTGPR